MTPTPIRSTLLPMLFAAITFCALSASAQSEFYDSIWDDDEYHSIRLDAPLAPDGNSDGDAEFSFQVGFGLGLSEVDEIGILLGTNDADIGNRSYFAFWFEENFNAINSMIPFAGVNIGWGSLSGAQGDDSIYGKLEGGVKYFVCPHCAFTGTLGYSLALENIYVKDDGTSDTNFEIGIGFRWYY